MLFVRIRQHTADAVRHRAHAEKIVHPLAERHLEAQLRLLREGKILPDFVRRKKAHIRLLPQHQAHQSRGVRQRREARKHALADGIFALARRAEHHQARAHVDAVGVEHALRVGRDLDRVLAALPRRLDPDDGRFGQQIVPLLQKRFGIVLVRRQRHDAPKFFDGFGRGRAAENLPAQPACAPTLQLFEHQAVLNVHIPVHAQIHKPQVFAPHRPAVAFAQLRVELHAFSPRFMLAKKRRQAAASGKRNGTPAW